MNPSAKKKGKARATKRPTAKGVAGTAAKLARKPAPKAVAKTAPRRFRGKSGVTRVRLIEVTIELLRRESFAALTSARIAREAGITQPGFYAHFSNVEECVREAVTQVVSTMQQKQSEARRRAFERAATTSDRFDRDLIRAIYHDMIEVALSEPDFAELFLRYRRDPSLLGGYVNQVMTTVRQDLTADVWRVASRGGFGPESYARVAFYSDVLLAMYSCAVEALLDGRFTDRAMIYDSLTEYTEAMLRVVSPRNTAP